MNKLSTLAKIANRLDSLGLTKEADVLDGLLRKLAEDGAAPQYAGQKYIDAYGTLLGVMSKEELIAELTKDLSAFGTTDSGTFSTGITKIESIFYYLYFTNINYNDIMEEIRAAGFDTSEYSTLYDLLESEDDGLAQKCFDAWDAANADYNATHPTAPAPVAPAVAPVKARAPVKDWAYYIKNTPAKDGVGGQEVYDAWKRFTSPKFGFGFTPDYNSFVAWWKNTPQRLYHPKEVVDALNAVIDRIPQGRVSGGSTAAQAEATRRDTAISSAKGEVPPPSNFKTNYDD